MKNIRYAVVLEYLLWQPDFFCQFSSLGFKQEKNPELPVFNCWIKSNNTVSLVAPRFSQHLVIRTEMFYNTRPHWSSPSSNWIPRVRITRKPRSTRSLCISCWYTLKCFTWIFLINFCIPILFFRPS